MPIVMYLQNCFCTTSCRFYYSNCYSSFSLL